ncbi:zinc-binding dehydrogenase [Oribacterium sp.]
MEKLGELFNAENPLEAFVDTAFSLEEVNEALDKVRQGKSKGKTILKIE